MNFLRYKLNTNEKKIYLFTSWHKCGRLSPCGVEGWSITPQLLNGVTKKTTGFCLNNKYILFDLYQAFHYKSPLK